MHAQAGNQPPIRVMLVDDHKAAILWGLERLVESAAPRMAVAGTACSRAGMLSAAASLKPDVTVLDLDLNGESSVVALPALLRASDVKVLVLTGERDPAVHQAAILNGARGVVGKDESAEVLLKAIESVHAGQAWINRVLMAKVVEGMAAGKSRKQDREEAKIASLTQREREIVRAIVRNHGDKSLAIAELLHISEHTLRNHLTLIYEKLGVRNRLGMYAFAMERGLAAD